MNSDIKNQEAVNHFDASLWNKVNALFLRKAISEFSHEKLITPQLTKINDEFNDFTIELDNQISYFFSARVLPLEHWWIDLTSIRKEQNETAAPLSIIEFIFEVNHLLKIPTDMLPTYLEELSNTLYGAIYKLKKNTITADELAKSDFQTIEKNMFEGHPCFIANNGRIGFNADDYQKFAPEASNGFKVLWVAGHKSKTSFTSIDSLNYTAIITQELGEEQHTVYQNTIKGLGLNPDDFYIFPMHPWQWQNKLSFIFADDITNQKLILLGEGKDTYQPQQSIRTLYNKSEEDKYYVKTGLSIQNMGFMRGLSPYYMQTTPGITSWITALLKEDNYLQKQCFSMLGEVATIGYRNVNFEPLGRTNAYNKMVAVLWRETPQQFLQKEEKAVTMASLLHIDGEGNALLKAFIDSSWLNVDQWIKNYLDAYLKPLLHCFYAYDLAFMPHGENIILKMKNNVPFGIFMKDITEEVVVFKEDKNYSSAVKRLVVNASNDVKSLTIFTDVFDCYFRFLSQILEEHCNFHHLDFWELVSQSIKEYQNEHPQFSSKFTECDLFADDFILSCLNRLQLQNNKQMVDLADPVNRLQFIGTIKNPIAKFKTVLNEFN
ncbi:IucA/IucC family siderophore biosynthesis protein [Flammeovirga pectinis]|uniref:IucA/IucC family siderophore biosynthesis protein n=1 Tax=Flammeovirga pectinis TaxID=2494373 RepID=A0A3Q9FQ77_9BACT|nr:IucA/IucC family siderophore biosynthesis protein [Flammeovirga pectinis]AZQ65416.1 IucA/IucC family siderophore biosynthesis protein [Flammeovirga pectinis]